METPASFLNQIYGFVSEGIIAYNPSGVIVYANDEANKLLHKMELVGVRLLDVFPEKAIKENREDTIIFQLGTYDFIFKKLGNTTGKWPFCSSRHFMIPRIGQLCVLSFTSNQSETYTSMMELRDALDQALNLMDAAAGMLGFIIFQTDSNLQEYEFTRNAATFFPHHPDGSIYSLDEFIEPADCANVFAAIRSVSERHVNRTTFSFTSHAFPEPHFYSGWCQFNPTKGVDGIIGGILDITSIIQTTLEQQNDKLKLQTSINACMENMLLGGEDIAESLRRITLVICEHFHADGGIVVQFSPDGSEAVPIASITYHKDRAVNTISKMKSMSGTINYGQWADLFAENRFVAMSNLTDSPDCPISRDIITIFGIRSLWAARLTLNDKLWGYLCVYFKEPYKDLAVEEDVPILSNFIDSTELLLRRMKLLQDIQDERDKAIAAEKAKSFFFASVSHDIRTPLNSIIGFSELLRDGVDDEELRTQFLNNIIFSGETLLQIINDVLDLAKLEADKMEFTPERMELEPLVHQILLNFSQSASKKKLKLIQDTPSIPPIEFDLKRLSRILFNLISNAVKFTERGHITVHAEFTKTTKTTGILAVSVDDTGIGIAEENQSKLLKPFVQINNSTQTGGTGLGLAICKSMTEHMNGKLTMKSQLGVGSVFTCTFNDVRFFSDDQQPEAPSKKPPANTAYRQLAILLVDDVKLNLLVLNAMLSNLEVADVTCANSGTEAVEMLKQRNFDLIITDLWMPDLSGDKIVKRIRDGEFGRSDLPVYVLTADSDVLKNYQDYGFTGILLKPITIEMVREFLESLDFV